MGTEQSWSDAEGRVSIERLSRRVVRLVLTGRLGEDAAAFLEERLGEELDERKRQRLFWDMESLEHYHSEVRVRATQALREHLDGIEALDHLSRSRLVAMGVSVANLALNGLVQTHRERADFERALANALERPAGASPPG